MNMRFASSYLLVVFLQLVALKQSRLVNAEASVTPNSDDKSPEGASKELRRLGFLDFFGDAIDDIREHVERKIEAIVRDAKESLVEEINDQITEHLDRGISGAGSIVNHFKNLAVENLLGFGGGGIRSEKKRSFLRGRPEAPTIQYEDDSDDDDDDDI